MPLTQGNLTLMNFNPNSAQFYALFNYSDQASGETVAYLNQEYWYTSGLTPQLVVNYTNHIDLDALGYTYENNYFSFDLSKVPDIKNGDLVSFSVTAN